MLSQYSISRQGYTCFMPWPSTLLDRCAPSPTSRTQGKDGVLPKTHGQGFFLYRRSVRRPLVSDSLSTHPPTSGTRTEGMTTRGKLPISGRWPSTYEVWQHAYRAALGRLVVKVHLLCPLSPEHQLRVWHRVLRWLLCGGTHPIGWYSGLFSPIVDGAEWNWD